MRRRIFAHLALRKSRSGKVALMSSRGPNEVRVHLQALLHFELFNLCASINWLAITSSPRALRWPFSFVTKLNPQTWDEMRSHEMRYCAQIARASVAVCKVQIRNAHLSHRVSESADVLRRLVFWFGTWIPASSTTTVSLPSPETFRTQRTMLARVCELLRNISAVGALSVLAADIIRCSLF